MAENEDSKVKAQKFVSRTISRLIEWFNYLPGVDQIQVEPMTVYSDSLPEAMEGMRIVCVSDLHAHRFGEDQERLERVVRELKPDLILVAGDWVRTEYDGEDREVVKAAARALTSVAPTYTNLGNHEALTIYENQSEEIDDLKDCGVTVLDDETAVFENKGAKLYLTGLTSGYTYYRYGTPGTRRRAISEMKERWLRAVEKVPEGAVSIAIGHRPELLKVYAALGADIVLCGHAHGGLMRLPGDVRLLAPDQGLFPRYTHGRHTEGKTEMIISQGLGGPRIGISPEVILMKMTGKK